MLRGIGIVVLSMLVMLLVLAGCNKLPGAGAPIVYPPDWPLKSVVVPPGATRPKVSPYSTVRAGNHQQEGYPNENTCWDLHFDYAGDQSEVKTHFDKCMKPLGFLCYLPMNRSGTSDYGGYHKELVGAYTNPEHNQAVVVTYREMPEVQGLSGNKPLMDQWKGYRIRIWFHTGTNQDPGVNNTTPIP